MSKKQELVSVQIETQDGINVVSSRVIAEGLGKRHKHVIRDLENIISESPNLGFQIIESSYKVPGNNKTYKEYLLTKDGFTLYMFNIQGYNDFKMAYINRFNEMEKSLQEAQPKLPETYLDALKALVASEEEKQKLLVEKAEMKPKTDFYDAVADSKTAISMGDMAKILQQNGVDIGAIRLFAWMRKNNFLMRSKEEWNLPTQKAMNQGLFFVKESLYPQPDGTSRINRTTKVTGKGQIYFVNKFLGNETRGGKKNVKM